MTKSYNWLKVIPPELVKLQDLSTTGAPEAFSWQALSESLAQRFELSDLVITPQSTRWMSEKELGASSGKQAVLNYSMAGLPGTVSWSMSERDLAILMAALLTQSAHPLDYSDRDFQKGFYRFIGITLANTLPQLGFQGDYALALLEDESSPRGPAVSIDIEVALLGVTVKGRATASEELVKEWKERFASTSGAASLDASMVKDVDIIVALEAGKVTLHPSELKQIHKGDFIILDSCTILPGEDKGRVMLTVRGMPIFRGMLKENKIKVLEYPLYHKVETTMDSNTGLNFDDEEHEDLGLSEEGAEPGVGTGEGPSLAERAKDIPVTISIEVGRLNMKLDKLMQMQPGQLLELDVNPEEGVSLVVNGQCIGKGELLKLGEVLGVRLLELG